MMWAATPGCDTSLAQGGERGKDRSQGDDAGDRRDAPGDAGPAAAMPGDARQSTRTPAPAAARAWISVRVSLVTRPEAARLVSCQSSDSGMV